MNLVTYGIMYTLRVVLICFSIWCVYQVGSFYEDRNKNTFDIIDIPSNFNTITPHASHVKAYQDYNENVNRGIIAIIKKSNPNLEKEKVLQYLKYIRFYSVEYNLNPFLVAAVIHRETNFNESEVSSVGARGPMQVFAKHHKDKLKQHKISEKDLHNINHGIKIGCQILSEYLRVCKGDEHKALRRYVGALSSKRGHGYARDVIRMKNYGAQAL